MLHKLRGMKIKYDHERKFLDDAISKGNKISIIHVMELREELFQLTYFGKTLKRLFHDISVINSTRNKAFYETVAPITSKSMFRRFVELLGDLT